MSLNNTLACGRPAGRLSSGSFRILPGTHYFPGWRTSFRPAADLSRPPGSCRAPGSQPEAAARLRLPSPLPHNIPSILPSPETRPQPSWLQGEHSICCLEPRARRFQFDIRFHEVERAQEPLGSTKGSPYRIPLGRSL